MIGPITKRKIFFQFSDIHTFLHVLFMSILLVDNNTKLFVLCGNIFTLISWSVVLNWPSIHYSSFLLPAIKTTPFTYYASFIFLVPSSYPLYRFEIIKKTTSKHAAGIYKVHRVSLQAIAHIINSPLILTSSINNWHQGNFQIC